ncbi:MAG: pyruvate, phosphate dikinase [Gemmatimonadetes bacterium]|nr:pyruvate, phosphate dikinase [Gemmatimonadota bacterium]MYC69104.1 pyruvate, phosphate dikinase [Gemmatimonadota bacterium]MYI63731.1 pyruvate, phosphate dikinase [Gemmatimonadota bacterium]
MTEKYVYLFGTDQSEGDKEMRNLLGGKGANLAEMAQLGLPVPAGFTITTEVCTYYYNHDQTYPDSLKGQVERAIAEVEKTMDMRFGDAANPLLLSVRSGARVSMPGMMETVLNLGLNDEIVQGLIKQSGDPRFCYDVYRRFVQMYGDVVMGLRPEDEKETDPFEALLDAKKHARGVALDSELSAEDLRELVAEFKAEIAKRLDREFPEDPHEQLWNAIGAVFGSWQGQRAIRYREIEDIPHDWGTAVNVQSMVYGNMGDDCATGVAFTRNPSTGEKHLYGEFLINAQGEDVVAGTRTPQPLSQLSSQMPRVYAQFQTICDQLEPHYRDMQDVEFTVQKGKLWMLQTRNGKRTGAAAVQIAVDMAAEGLISQEEALLRVTPDQLDQLLHPTFDEASPKDVIAEGLPASPGAATGQVVFNSQEAETQAAEGQQVILVRQETSPEDIGGMDAAQGILTARGGASSHAALVARGMGKCCVAGCESIAIDYHQELFTANGKTVKKGDWISIDGSSGQVMLGQVPTVEPSFSSSFDTMMGWADDKRRLAVRTNADTPHDSEVARNFGAEGIGLCRTEHMFFEGDRIVAVREMILAADEAGRRQALAKLKPIQRLDFEGIFTAMDGLPVTIRLLDPPLHEFLPHEPAQQQQMAEEMGVPLSQIEAKIVSLHEFNPMLGHRGCRLGITYPEIYEMQVEAIFEAAVNVRAKGVNPLPEIMIPLVGTEREFSDLKAMIDRVAVAVEGTIEYLVGTMIEIPRAALLADQIAEQAEFFSFGTNDLTQLTFGYSRDDAGKFLPEYVAQGILADDPFQSLDQEGTGQLVRLGTERGRSTRPQLKVGICGEHGGDPSSVGFCHEVGLDYVSCSPYRVPIARLAAAQAALAE